MMHNYFGSHLKNSYEMANYLAEFRREDGGYMYDITMITWADDDIF